MVSDSFVRLFHRYNLSNKSRYTLTTIHINKSRENLKTDKHRNMFSNFFLYWELVTQTPSTFKLSRAYLETLG